MQAGSKGKRKRGEEGFDGVRERDEKKGEVKREKRQSRERTNEKIKKLDKRTRGDRIEGRDGGSGNVNLASEQQCGEVEGKSESRGGKGRF